MLRDADQPFPKTSNLPEDVLEAVGGLPLGLAPGKEIMDLLQESNMPEAIRFALAQAVEMNPPQQNIAQEHPRRLGHLLVQR